MTPDNCPTDRGCEVAHPKSGAMAFQLQADCVRKGAVSYILRVRRSSVADPKPRNSYYDKFLEVLVKSFR